MAKRSEAERIGMVSTREHDASRRELLIWLSDPSCEMVSGGRSGVDGKSAAGISRPESPSHDLFSFHIWQETDTILSQSRMDNRLHYDSLRFQEQRFTRTVFHESGILTVHSRIKYCSLVKVEASNIVPNKSETYMATTIESVAKKARVRRCGEAVQEATELMQGKNRRHSAIQVTHNYEVLILSTSILAHLSSGLKYPYIQCP